MAELVADMNRRYTGCEGPFLTISLHSTLAIVHAAPLIAITKSGKDGSRIVTNWELVGNGGFG